MLKLTDFVLGHVEHDQQQLNQAKSCSSIDNHSYDVLNYHIRKSRSIRLQKITYATFDLEKNLDIDQYNRIDDKDMLKHRLYLMLYKSRYVIME